MENIIERAVILARESTRTPKDLPVYLKILLECAVAGDETGTGNGANDDNLTFTKILELTEQKTILRALLKYNFNQSQAARPLGSLNRVCVIKSKRRESPGNRNKKLKI